MSLQSAWVKLGESPSVHHLALAFARSLQRLLGESDPLVLWIAYGLMHDLEEGQGCWSLNEVHSRVKQLWVRAWGEQEPPDQDWGTIPIDAESLLGCRGIGDAQSSLPLILDQERLYLRKLFQAELWIARSLRERLAAPVRALPSCAQASLSSLFSFSEDLVTDLQCVAAVNAWMAPVALLAGGPGTGKTYTVVNYLALSVLASPTPPKILLLAPTGKAATRLAQSVQAAKERLTLSAEVKAAIPDEGQTLHRALGLGGQCRPRHDRHAPLDAELVVVDETSMVDLVMMAQLLDALAPQARLLLVGDSHQLASVQAGAVFGDFCLGMREWTPSNDWRAAVEGAIQGDASPTLPSSISLADVSVHLQTSRRYDPNQGIGRFSRALLAGDSATCFALLRDPEQSQLRWIELAESSPEQRQVQGGFEPLLPECKEGYAKYWAAGSPAERLEASSRFQVLCATRQGPYGVESANDAMWKGFRRERQGVSGSETGNAGMSIMMTRNDYSTGLFNGDIGVIDRSESQGLRAYFEKSSADAEPLALSLSRIGSYDPAFAMTIHKSQGSEFDKVLIVLGDRPGPGLNRELLYTAVTRAKSQVCIVASASVIRGCIEQAIHRRSGLGARLDDAVSPAC